MPLIQCHVSVPLDDTRKKQLIVDLVDATERMLGASPGTVSVIVHQHDAASVRELAFVSATSPPV
ncbi:tautomerase family protein [Lysobacter sp. A6]|uniref:Tautomerase family protein n=1 Tax=Noviluteimonas lactosilytica TaxID=2888523 RepID=A0ABS8JLI4_9GAMM|nr:tautomerase family protein [Lysobacter lactosilyticus]MCC8364475.1 tautomerase family protein [Lysobacter lactosilyticus]